MDVPREQLIFLMLAVPEAARKDQKSKSGDSQKKGKQNVPVGRLTKYLETENEQERRVRSKDRGLYVKLTSVN